MSLKNKQLKKEAFKAGKTEYILGRSFYIDVKNPLKFYNSDEFRKMKNRKKGKK